MIPVCQDEISRRPAGTSRFAGIKFQPVQAGQISPYDYMRKFNLKPVTWENFPPFICLDLHAFSLNFSL